MDLELDEQQLALQATVRRVLAEQAPISPYVRGVVGPGRRSVAGGTDSRSGSEAGSGWRPDAPWASLAALGALGVVAPDEAGGLAMGMVEAVIVAEEMGRALYPGPWLASALAAVRTLAAAGARADVLAAVASGDTPAAAGLAFPLSDSAPSEVTSTDQNGRHALHGHARHVLGATQAQLLVIPALLNGTTAVFTVRTGDDGVEVVTEAGVDRTLPLGHVRLTGAPATLIGTIEDEALRHVSADVLVAAAADAVGAAEAVMTLAIDYAKERRQFDQPIGAFQAVQHLCVDMFETVELARGGVLHAAWASDSTTPAGTAERRRAALRLKGFTDRLATVGDTAIQVFGGIGFTWEHDSHLYLKRLLTWSAFGGSASRYRQALGAITAQGATKGGSVR